MTLLFCRRGGGRSGLFSIAASPFRAEVACDSEQLVLQRFSKTA